MTRRLQAVTDENFQDLSRQLSEVPPTTSGGGDGYNGDMNTARIIKLEEFAEDAKQRLTRVETRLEHIDREVSNVKWWIIGAVLTIVLTTVATVIGTGIGIQQMTVSTFQAAGAQPQPAPVQQPPIIINVPAAQPAPGVAPQQ